VALAPHFPTRGVGAAARPLPAKHGRFIAVQACKGRDAARAGGWLSRHTSPPAGSGGGGARDEVTHRRGWEPRRDRCQRARRVLWCAHATGVTRRGRAGGSRDALPHSRGREPRRGPCQRSTAASSRCKRARDVTRRGWAGAGRTCSRATVEANRRASIESCSRVMGGLWTEQKSITRHHERLHR